MDGIDRMVASPSLLDADWDITRFVYNPNFDLGVDAAFLPAALETAPIPTIDQGQACGDLESQLEWTATAENPKKCLKLSLG